MARNVHYVGIRFSYTIAEVPLVGGTYIFEEPTTRLIDTLNATGLGDDVLNQIRSFVSERLTTVNLVDSSADIGIWELVDAESQVYGFTTQGLRVPVRHGRLEIVTLDAASPFDLESRAQQYEEISVLDDFVGREGRARFHTYEYLNKFVAPLFTSASDTVDFNTFTTADAALGLGDHAFTGDDTVVLPSRAKAIEIGYAYAAFDGGIGNDTITGGDLGEMIYGGFGEDRLSGAGGDDTLYAGDARFFFVSPDDSVNWLDGGAGNDTLIAVTSQRQIQDKLTGGSGRDTFYVDGRDYITDFEVGETAHLFGGSSVDRAIIYTEADFTTISFFSDTLNRLEARIAFEGRIDPDDFSITFSNVFGGAPSASITYSPNAEARASRALEAFSKKLIDTFNLLKPALEYGAGELFSKIYKKALEKSADALKKKIVKAILENSEKHIGEATAKAFTDMADKACQKILKNMLKKNVDEQQKILDAKDLMQIFVEVLHPFAGKSLKLSEVVIKTGFEFAIQNIDKDFDSKFLRAPDTREIIRPKDNVTFKNNSFETSDTKYGYVGTKTGLDAYKASATKKDALISGVDVDRGPAGVDTIRLADIPAAGGTGQKSAAAPPPTLLVGNGLSNTLTGNRHDNTISGKQGNDVLTGGAGKDSFVFDTALRRNVDTITDFSVRDDTILLDDDIFRALPKVPASDKDGTIALPKSAFVANATGRAEDRDDRIVYNRKDGTLSYDADGTGATTPIVFAQIGEGLRLTAADFLVIA
ncbi:calcium-binding protein [Ensifer soli]|uniref:calcium-binding protein n=1 Tax=Ciceribacter sp. sgz301302 TaxID=3342379 RepID=UPI0035B8F9F4